MKLISKISMAVLCLVLVWGCAPAEKDQATNEDQKETSAVGLENGSATLATESGGEIHYVVSGTGPACIMLTNSWGLNHKPLQTMFSDLEDVFTMIYFDARGMGDSSPVEEDSDMSMAAVREDAVAILDHLGLEKSYVMGWSNGAANTYMFVGEYPERVTGAIALHSLEKMDQEDMAFMQEKYADMNQKYMEYTLQMNSDELTEEEKAEIHRDLYMEWFPMMLADREKNEEALVAAFAEADLSYKHANYSYMNDTMTFDATEMLQKATCPMLFIAGTADSIRPESMKRAADLVENSTFVVFEESGHFAQMEEPEKFKETIINFVASIK
jgi:pimeloyl-ACP methyl ester carboxylesterase